MPHHWPPQCMSGTPFLNVCNLQTLSGKQNLMKSNEALFKRSYIIIKISYVMIIDLKICYKLGFSSIKKRNTHFILKNTTHPTYDHWQNLMV